MFAVRAASLKDAMRVNQPAIMQVCFEMVEFKCAQTPLTLLISMQSICLLKALDILLPLTVNKIPITDVSSNICMKGHI